MQTRGPLHDHLAINARRWRAVATAALVISLAACGQKGSLVLPDSDTSGVVIRGPDGAPATTVSQPERREPAKRAPTVPAPTQSPPETAPRSSTPR
jgi:predicted small lipoprotein YifL